MKFISQSQAGQDEWVNRLLPKPGLFLDVGSGHPTNISNTAALERIGWSGYAIDEDAPSVELYAKERPNTRALRGDARTIHWTSCLSTNKFDYLSLDVDEAQVDALKNLLAHHVTFKVATIEHASYLYGNGPRDEIRKLLRGAGYHLLCEDVAYGGNVYEDWWVDLKQVSPVKAFALRSRGLEGAFAAAHRPAFNGFNGQTHRHEIFAELVARCGFDGIVETGACNGETSGYMAEISGLPVLTCEIDEKWYLEACRRVKGFDVMIAHSDSRWWLRENLAKDSFIAGQRTCFYLDAHWGTELPLAEEVETILASWKNCVVMIDDFQVPGDPGYGFDDYGGDKKIRIETIASSVAKHGASAFYPKEPSSTETGAKRGSCFIASAGEMAELLAAMSCLR